jgi:hypothetical protein
VHGWLFFLESLGHGCDFQWEITQPFNFCPADIHTNTAFPSQTSQGGKVQGERISQMEEGLFLDN